ncbi:uncharacterized protein LOC135391745 [Ornithodoros turicata]|uniref:uncharacterized protein LOC135391745 n=1 Tax=Ornithodoros turicata TaxID=34597 RepID=UPI003139D936
MNAKPPYPYKRSSGKHCSVSSCYNNQRRRQRLLKTECNIHKTTVSCCQCGIFSLHRFPSEKKNPHLRSRWIDALKRKDFEPTVNARVCSIHFADGKPTFENPVPELHMGEPTMDAPPSWKRWKRWEQEMVSESKRAPPPSFTWATDDVEQPSEQCEQAAEERVPPKRKGRESTRKLKAVSAHISTQATVSREGLSEKDEHMPEQGSLLAVKEQFKLVEYPKALIHPPPGYGPKTRFTVVYRATDMVADHNRVVDIVPEAIRDDKNKTVDACVQAVPSVCDAVTMYDDLIQPVTLDHCYFRRGGEVQTCTVGTQTLLALLPK